MPDNRFEVQSYPTCTYIQVALSISDLSRQDGIWREGTSKIFMQSPGSQLSCDAGQAAVQSNHQCQWEDRFHAIEQEKKGVAALLHRQKARN